MARPRKTKAKEPEVKRGRGRPRKIPVAYRASPLIPKNQTPEEREDIRIRAENDLAFFINLVAPNRMLGSVHVELCGWMEREGHKSHQLILFPRDHQKSTIIAFRVAQRIAKQPDVRFIYVSVTAGLAEKQLKFIKDILTSDIFMYYWPSHIHPEEGKRTKWTNSEIAIDHPKRKEEFIRDPTVSAYGLTASMTGLHCDVAVFDDVVVLENAYSEEGRNKVSTAYSLLASVEGANAEEWVVGTRYHPKDLYQSLIDMQETIHDKHGNVIDAENVYEVFQRQVETNGDGSGEYLWPRQMRPDGKWFGFNQEILAKKRAQYLDRTQFRAQYYNDPMDPDGGAVKRECFQSYDKGNLSRSMGHWYLKDKKLSIMAAMDFAFTTNSKSDYSAIVVIGMDSERNVYVLDIDQFKVDKISEMYQHLFDLYMRWNFQKLRCETTVAQATIVNELKEQYIKPNGIPLSIITNSLSGQRKNKFERISAILEPRYSNRQVWHYSGGNCQSLEEQLVARNPLHDDIKDALASAVEIIQPPIVYNRGPVLGNEQGNVTYNSRFGGVSW